MLDSAWGMLSVIDGPSGAVIGAQLTGIGLVVGALIGLTGVGSGSLVAPILLFAGVNPANVVGSDLAFATITKAAGAALHVQAGTVDWGWARRLAYGSVPGVLLGSVVISRTSHSPDFIRALVGLVLVASAIAAIVTALLGRRITRGREQVRNSHGEVALLRTVGDSGRPVRRRSSLQVATIGFVIGVLVGATSVGSGSLVDIALILFSALSGARLVGTGIVHAVILSAVASAAHWRLGTIDPAIVIPLLLGSIPGVVVGTWGARRAPPSPLRWAVTALVFASGATLITQVTLQ